MVNYIIRCLTSGLIKVSDGQTGDPPIPVHITAIPGTCPIDGCSNFTATPEN